MKLYKVYANGAKAARDKLASGSDPWHVIEGFHAGGKGDLGFSEGHVAAMRVPKGGSCCANCEYVDKEAHACKNPHYIVWNKGDYKLPDYPLDEICSDWYNPAKDLK